jgi:hypothetical protein
MRAPCLLSVIFALALPALAADPPTAEISNSTIHAKLYLPDATDGYYRATRFDWSGVISSLEWNGHKYFGQWFPRYDPKLNDAIMGPVEEFQTNLNALGYDEAKPGETFVKIGVGVLKKPEEPAYRQFGTYDIVDNGKWTVNRGADFVEFIQDLTGPNGYAYRYTKVVRLAKDKPILTLEHTLRNTGKKTIENSVYEHNFYMLDGEPTGPDFTVTFPFQLTNTADFRGLAEVQGTQLRYLKELQRGQTAQSELKGFGATAADYDIRVENSKTGAAVRQRGDRPISRINFWSIRTTLCPEAYVSMKIEPGQEFKWNISYEFYEAKKK